MSAQNSNPGQQGTRFGEVVVNVNLALGDCVVTAPQRMGITTAPRTIRLHSLEEIQGAYQAQLTLAQRSHKDHPHAADIACALKHAGQRIKAHQGRKRT